MVYFENHSFLYMMNLKWYFIVGNNSLGEDQDFYQSLDYRLQKYLFKMPGGALEKNFKKVRTAADVTNVLRNFYGSERKRVGESMLKRLLALREAIEQSTFFREHEARTNLT